LVLVHKMQLTLIQGLKVRFALCSWHLLNQSPIYGVVLVARNRRKSLLFEPFGDGEGDIAPCLFPAFFVHYTGLPQLPWQICIVLLPGFPCFCVVFPLFLCEMIKGAKDVGRAQVLTNYSCNTTAP
jgi:hypothetical protein